MGGNELFACDVIADAKRFATFGATTVDDFAAVLCGHSLAETVLVYSAAVGGLKGSFHCCMSVFVSWL